MDLTCTWPLKRTNLSPTTSHGTIAITKSTTRTIARANSHTQTSIGTGYDLSNSVFSPDGRNFQVEYAVKAVENGGTAVGIRCKDGVVLALEKLVTSKLLKKDANKRIAAVDRHVGVVSTPPLYSSGVMLI